MNALEKNKKFILDKESWPRWPWLPIKRWINARKQLETGLLYADDPDEKTGAVRLFQGYPYSKYMRTYDSLDALLFDGWVVD